MGTVIQDTFTGAEQFIGPDSTGTPPPATGPHTPDLNVGGGGDTYTDFLITKALKIDGSGKCTAAVGSGGIVAGDILQNFAPGPGSGIFDYSATIDVVVPNQAVVATYLIAAGLLVRVQDGSSGGHSWYVAIKNVLNTVNGYKVVLGQLPSGTEVNLATGLSLNNSTHTLSVSMTGNVYTVKLDGVTQGSAYTDGTNTYTTAKGVGPFIVTGLVGGIGTFPNTTLDNFEVDTVPLVITTASLPNGQVSTAYSQTITSQGGYQPTVTYAVTAGALPPGLTLSSAGVLSGTPTTAGTYPFSITASDTLSDTSAPVMYTVTITGGSQSRYLVRPDPGARQETRTFQQKVAQILNGLFYSGSFTVSPGGIFTVGGIAIGATVTGGHYLGGATGGDVLFVGVGTKLAQDDNFTFLETALGGPKLTVTSGEIACPGGIVTGQSIRGAADVQVGSLGQAGNVQLSTSFPLVVGFFQAVDDVVLIGTAGYLDWGNITPGPNFPSHVFENSTGGLVARAVVGILQSSTAPLLAGLSNISIGIAPNFLFSIDSTGNYFGPTATFTTTSASALVVTTGTNNVFQVDASTGSSATGVKITGQTAGGGARIAAISSGTNESLDLDPKGTSTVNVNTHAGAVANAGMNVTGAVAITSTATTAFTAGRQGTTNAAFRVNANAATQLTGILVTGQNTGGTGAQIATISSATNESMLIDAKGTGTVKINSQPVAGTPPGGTGLVQIGGASSGNNATGLTITPKAAASGLAIAVVSTGTNENLTLDAKGSGTIGIGLTSTGIITLGANTAITGTETVTSTSASALAVGRQGATNPVLQVNANTASVITGVQVTGAASGGGVNLAAISTATDESITLDAKGAGTVNLGTNSSGNINLNDNVRVAGNLGATGTNPGLAILGSNTNDSAFTAFIGEYLPSLVASGGALGITAATAKNITSLTLTAGDWDVEGNVNFTTAAATFSGLQAGLSSTSATLPTDGSECYSGLVGTLLTDVDTITLPKKRFSLASTTTIYLVGYCNVISAGTVSGFGAITARRVR